MRTVFRPLSGVLVIAALIAFLCVASIPTNPWNNRPRKAGGKWAVAASILAMELGAELQTVLARPGHKREEHLITKCP